MSNQTIQPSFGPSLSMAALGAGVADLAFWYRRPVPAWCEQDDDTPPRSILVNYLPTAEYTGEVSVIIHASPEAIFEAMQRVTLDDMPIANWLGNLRYLPARLAGNKQATTRRATSKVPFLELLQGDGGNIVLGVKPGREYVLGAIGKFHNLFNQHFVPLHAPHEFVAFDHPDYQKLAMSFTITPLPEGTGHRLTLVHGTHALSRAARWKFALYWLAIKPGGNYVSWLMLRAIKSIAERATVAAGTVRA